METKAKFLQVGKLKKQFSNTKCLIPISVGQNYHINKRFQATINLINEHRFQHCSFIICDTLQRHSLQIFNPLKTPDEIYLMSIKNGEDWLTQHQPIIDQLNMSHDIMVWDDWCSHKDYPKLRESVEKLYKENSHVKNAIDSYIMYFLDRLENKKPDISLNRKRAFLASLEYIKEEMAVMPLFVEGNYEFEIYPKPRPIGMKISHDYFVKSKSDLLKRICIKFFKK